MAIQVKINNGTGLVDVTRYVEDASLKIEDSINVPNMCDFTMVNIDNVFVAPVRNAYVTVFSTKESRFLFTGFVTSAPQVEYLGSAPNASSASFKRNRYKVQATSDEYLLNIKSVPFIPAFVNQTMGQILANLANILAPSFFDTSGIQNGDLIPFFQYDPTQKWSDLAKTFCDAARFYYQVVNKKIIFEQYNGTSLGVSYDDTKGQGTFDPYSLKTDVLTVPPVNDAIVIGDVEPQNIHDDFFIGDGVTSNFPLRHSTFRGASQLLLQEDWTEQSIPNSWTVVDPQNALSMVGSLAVQMAASGAIGTEYIIGQNGLQLGGHLDIQHGEFFFTGKCNGLVGGVYSSSPPTLGSCILGFQVASATGVNVAVTASGASGLQIQPILNGVALPGSTPVTTKINHHYFLETFITARRWSRYNQIYRTLAGTPFGDALLPAQAQITFIVWDIDLHNPDIPVPTKYYTIASLPSFGLYAPINAGLLNLSLNYTLINQPPQGLLTVQSLYGPTGLNLPIQTPGPAEPYNLGFGFGQQVATIAASPGTVQGTSPDALQFYAGSLSASNTWIGGTIPAAGARIRLMSWEAGKALARVRDPVSIASEAALVGDDGLRTGIFADLNPLPRTSDESDLAAKAVTLDREAPQYDGSYTVYDYFRDKTQDFPRSGRLLFVNSPTRGVSGQQFLVRSVNVSVESLPDEIIVSTIEFGQDLFVERLLKRFLPPQQNILDPKDAAVTPPPQTLAQVGTTYTSDLVDVSVLAISGGNVYIDLGSIPVTGAEIRRVDTGWGISKAGLVTTATSRFVTLQRTQYEQIWYVRQVNGPAISRRSRVVRVVYPLVPAPPLLLRINTVDQLHPTIQFQFNGDIRNIRGIEIRDSDNATVLLQKTVASLGDLLYTFDNTVKKTSAQTFYVYFFNLMWEYSAPLFVTMYIGLPSTPIDAIIHTGVSAGGGNNYDYRQFAVHNYVIAAGDLLEYDIFVDPTSPQIEGGIDFQYATPVATDSFPGTSLSGNWTVQEGTFVVSGGVVSPSSGGADTRAGAVYTGASFQNDQYSQATIAGNASSTTKALGVAVRMASGAETYYCFYVDNAAPETAFLFKVVAGVTTVFATKPYVPVLGDVLRLEVIGTTLTAYLNGAVFLTGTDATIASGNPGIAGTVGSPQQGLSNWSGGSAGSYFRSTSILDQNSLGTHPSTDLSGFAAGQWYHRIFSLNSLVGSIISAWLIAQEGDPAGTYLIRAADIRITNGPSIKAVIFTSAQVNGSMFGPLPAPFSTGYSSVKTFTQVISTGVVNMDEHTVDGATRFGQTASGLSYRPITNPLTGHDAGSNVTVNVASFTMRTSSKGDVSISSGSVAALSYNTLYYIYYDDASLGGGGVTYAATTSKETALAGSGRFFVGSVQTPKSGAADTIGNNDGGAGAQIGLLIIVFASNNGMFVGNVTGSGAITNPNNGNDADTSTFAKLTITVGAPAIATLNPSGFSNLLVAAKSITLKVRTAVPTNNVGSTALLQYSINGGATFTDIFRISGGTTRGLTTDSITLSAGQNLAAVQLNLAVNAPGGGGATAELDFYESWIEVQT